MLMLGLPIDKPTTVLTNEENARCMRNIAIAARAAIESRSYEDITVTTALEPLLARMKPDGTFDLEPKSPEAETIHDVLRDLVSTARN